jgi:hypothetical protein
MENDKALTGLLVGPYIAPPPPDIRGTHFFTTLVKHLQNLKLKPDTNEKNKYFLTIMF